MSQEQCDSQKSAQKAEMTKALQEKISLLNECVSGNASVAARAAAEKGACSLLCAAPASRLVGSVSLSLWWWCGGGGGACGVPCNPAPRTHDVRRSACAWAVLVQPRRKRDE